MLIFYNWGGGEVAAGGGGEIVAIYRIPRGILISSRYCQTALPPTLLTPPPPPPHIISFNFLLNTTFHQLFTETHIDLRCTSTCIYHKWSMRGRFKLYIGIALCNSYSSSFGSMYLFCQHNNGVCII